MSGRALSDKEKQAAILVVDDQALTRNMVKTALKGAGFEQVYLAEDGEQALHLLQERPIDLFVVDWKMPGLSGIELLKHIRKAETEVERPFIMLTGHCTREAVVEAASQRVSGYIGKPFSPDELIKKITQLLRRPPIAPVKDKGSQTASP